MAIITFVGKCQRCGTGVAAEADVDYRTIGPGKTRVVDRRTRAPLDPTRRVRCRCGALTTVTRVEGRHAPGTTCDEVCWKATTPICTCSCSGSSHGRAFLPRLTAPPDKG